MNLYLGFTCVLNEASITQIQVLKMLQILSRDSTRAHFVHTCTCLTYQVWQEEGLTGPIKCDRTYIPDLFWMRPLSTLCLIFPVNFKLFIWRNNNCCRDWHRAKHGVHLIYLNRRGLTPYNVPRGSFLVGTEQVKRPGDIVSVCQSRPVWCTRQNLPRQKLFWLRQNVAAIDLLINPFEYHQFHHKSINVWFGYFFTR